jgi:hypothetical protein
MPVTIANARKHSAIRQWITIVLKKKVQRLVFNLFYFFILYFDILVNQLSYPIITPDLSSHSAASLLGITILTISY